MKIDFSKYKIVKIFYNDKAFCVNTISYDDLGIKLTYSSEKFLDEYDYDMKKVSLGKLKCIDEDKECTIFDVVFEIKYENCLIAHLSFKKIIYYFVGDDQIMYNKLFIRLNLSKLLFTNVFKFNSIKIDDDITLELGNDSLSFKSINYIKENDLYKYFTNFYEYFNILSGFFPRVLDVVYFNNEKAYKYIYDFPDIFITKDCYIRKDSFFACPLSSEEFISSYNAFISLKHKITMSLEAYFYSMMENNSYVEYSVVFMLQSLDGLFKELEIFKDKQKLFLDTKKKEIIVRYKSIDISDIVDSSVLSHEDINNLFGYINVPSFKDKLKIILDVYNKNFNYEKSLAPKDGGTLYDEMLAKFVNTRNKFSHANNDAKKCLSNIESLAYSYKILLVFRLCILKEIKIIFDHNLLDRHLNAIDLYINAKVKL